MHKLRSYSPIDRAGIIIDEEFVRSYMAMRQQAEDRLKAAGKTKGLDPERERLLYFVLHYNPRPDSPRFLQL
jgi:hypothetical protein